MGINHRSVLGWSLVAAFAVVVSCSSDGGKASGAPAGFGNACRSNKDCASYALLCSDDDECVQCLDNAGCKRSELCSAGLCRAADACDSSRDCSRSQVCDESLALCVDCRTSADCSDGQACVESSCAEPQACRATRDCAADLVCDPDGVCVQCVEDSDCDSVQVCRARVCEDPGGGNGSGGDNGDPGGGGTGGTGAGGKSDGGTDRGGTSTGGSQIGGTQSGGSAGTAMGGAGSDCACNGAEVCTVDGRCVAPTLLDDLFDCDDEILEIEGRRGTWAADADYDINLMHGFGNPGSGWADNSCAAWATGGISPSALDVSFAFIGFQLNDGSAYDLSDYSGLRVKLESDGNVQVVLKTTGGGYFDYVLTPMEGSNLRSAPFSGMSYMQNSTETSLDLSKVYEVQFSPTDPTAFGMAVHRVELY